MTADDEPWFRQWMSWRARPKVFAADVAQPMQDVYRSMMNDLISPELRSMGLKGSAGNYSIPSDHQWALLGFQKSRHSDALQVRFTVNLAVVSKSAWAALREAEPFHPAKPSAQLGTNKAGTDTRIGHLYPVDPGDRWWSMTPAVDVPALVADVLLGVRQYGVPWLHDRMNA